MRRSRHMRLFVVATALLTIAMLGGTRCGRIADKDRIRIAKIQDEYITRGDLREALRRMPNEERPLIQNKGDLLRALRTYLDDEIKAALADELSRDGKITAKREVAEAIVLQQHPEFSYNIQNPEDMGMTEADLEYVKQEREIRIDEMMDKILGDQAVAYRAQEAVKAGLLKIADEEFEREYGFLKDTLVVFEQLEFIGLRFPASVQGAQAAAARVRERLDNGELIDPIAEEVYAQNPNLVMRGVIENNPAVERFRGFWMTASGCKRGDIIGPVFLPPSQGANEQGQDVVQPAAYLVLQVLSHEPERPKTLDEAKPALVPQILFGKTMAMLREEFGVEVYEDKLPDPDLLGSL